MKQTLTSIAIDLLAPAKAYPAPLTDKTAVRALVQRLQPMSTSQPLIRLGPNGDGGYLVPDDLAGVEACFSPGVSLISGFEKDCAEMGMQVFLADRSVEQPAEMHKRFHFIKKYVGVTSNDDFMTVDDWVAAALPGSTSDLLLQIDIEGFEYETFLAMSDRLMGRFRIIVAEFHDLHQLWNRPFFRLVSRAFDKILQTHTCVHIHPNNCATPLNKFGLSIPPLLEVTFLRNDRVHHPSPATVFPHALDFDCADRPQVVLPACWHAKA